MFAKRYEAQSSNPNTKQIQCDSLCLEYNRFCLKKRGSESVNREPKQYVSAAQIRGGRLLTSIDSIGRESPTSENMIFIPVQDAKKQLRIFSFFREG